jgi:hypothetical protein
VSAGRWSTTLLSGYQSTNILLCPTDDPNATTLGAGQTAYPADAAPRSYMINGWNDYFQQNSSPSDFNTYVNTGTSPLALRELDVPYPSDTVAFGEKRSDSGQFYMDLYEGEGNDLTELELGRHSNVANGYQHTGNLATGGAANGEFSGGANHAFVDGSAHYIKYGLALGPINLWAVTDYGRTNDAVIF